MKSVMLFIAALSFGFSTSAAGPIDIQVLAPEVGVSARTVDYSSYNFGPVRLNSLQTIAYKLTNTGTTPLTFQGATISGIGFDASHSCANGLRPGQQCRFVIRYSPVFEGFDSGRFVISFVEDLDLVVDVTGQGTRF